MPRARHLWFRVLISLSTVFFVSLYGLTSFWGAGLTLTMPLGNKEITAQLESGQLFLYCLDYPDATFSLGFNPEEVPFHGPRWQTWPLYRGYSFSGSYSGYFACTIAVWPFVAIAVGICAIALRQIFARRRGDCPKCGYCLTGNTSGICPECGTPVSVQKKAPVWSLPRGYRSIFSSLIVIAALAFSTFREITIHINPHIVIDAGHFRISNWSLDQDFGYLALSLAPTGLHKPRFDAALYHFEAISPGLAYWEFSIALWPLLALIWIARFISRRRRRRPLTPSKSQSDSPPNPA